MTRKYIMIKISTKECCRSGWIDYMVLCMNNVRGMANSADPDKTFLWSALFDLASLLNVVGIEAQQLNRFS